MLTSKSTIKRKITTGLAAAALIAAGSSAPVLAEDSPRQGTQSAPVVVAQVYDAERDIWVQDPHPYDHDREVFYDYEYDHRHYDTHNDEVYDDEVGNTDDLDDFYYDAEDDYPSADRGDYGVDDHDGFVDEDESRFNNDGYEPLEPEVYDDYEEDYR